MLKLLYVFANFVLWHHKIHEVLGAFKLHKKATAAHCFASSVMVFHASKMKSRRGNSRYLLLVSTGPFSSAQWVS